MSEIKVGSKIWRLDSNHRLYEQVKNAAGKMVSPGGSIYRNHWIECEIVAETSRSWVNSWGIKIPKKGPHYGFAFTQQEVDDRVWVHDSRFKIVSLLEREWDVQKLKQVAEILGYKQ